MSSSRQIFQASSPLRWKIFTWSNRFLIAAICSGIVAVMLSLFEDSKPELPVLQANRPVALISNSVVPKTMNDKELKKFHGFSDFLTPSTKSIINPSASKIRAAFYVDWDPQSFYSLQRNIAHVNMVLPEWFFLTPGADTLTCSIDTSALSLMRKSGVAIIPILNNINLFKSEGQFDGSLVHRILSSRSNSASLIESIVSKLEKYHLQGINIDFEELNESTDESLVAFQEMLYKRLHALGYLVTQDIMPSNEDYNRTRLADVNDYLFLMAYDEYYSTSVPGPVSAQRWIEKTFSEFVDRLPEEKVILCVAGYGYDWTQGREAETITYQQAMALARDYRAEVQFNNDTYNCFFQYKDADSVQHKVYFTDAATNYNTLRFAEVAGAGGTALWRLGSEDERIWRFYDRDLSNAMLKDHPFDFTLLESSSKMINEPDYIGDGEVLNVIAEPEPGLIQLQTDSISGIISEEKYISYPTNYVIRKFGQVSKQVILTFDDGPDPAYTPAILDILQKQHVPATFFVVGMNAEENLPILRRIWKEGYEIGNHTFTHPNMAEVSDSRAFIEMESTRKLIESTIGRSTVLFRAPYNADAEPTKQVELKPVAISRDNNYYTVGESIDPNDWEHGITAQQIYDRVIRQYEQNPSKGIILLHDAGGNRQATVEALPLIIEYFKKHGIAFTTVSHLLNKPLNEIMPPVDSKLLSVDQKVASVGYYFETFMSVAFWTAIVLGILRIATMGMLAGINYRKEKFQSTIPVPVPDLPEVVVVVPGYNEEVNAVRTIESLLKQDYPKLRISFVDDGSTDKTYERVLNAFNNHPKVTVYNKMNGGKASALNYGISMTDAEYLVCIDADTQLAPTAISKLMQTMLSNENVGAVAGTVRVGNEVNMLTRWQSIEYTTAQNFDRRAMDLVNGITVVPGAIGAFKKQAVIDAGGFTSDTLAEDCDLTIRILKEGYRVLNCPSAIAVTEAPETLSQFMKQRFRWSYGIMQSFWKNRKVCFKPSYKALGLISLPNLLIFQICLALLAPLADLMLLFSIFWNHTNPGGGSHLLLYYIVFLVIDLGVSLVAFRFERLSPGKLVWIIPQRFVYRQLMYVILYKAIVEAIKGRSQGWGVLQRSGRAELTT